MALSNPQQYVKRAVPSQDEKIKLIVLFEKHENADIQFDYAELLVDETNDLIAEVQNVSAAAANGDLGAYASLFANVDVPYFLSIATEAPVYTEGLSAALQTALESYSQSIFRPTVTTMTTRTFTTVSTIVTNVVSGTVTVPTTLYSTVVVTSVGPATSGRETYTSHTTEIWAGVTSETVSEVVRESTLPNGQVTRITERVTVGAPGEHVTTEVATAINGRVETRTVTRGEGGVVRCHSSCHDRQTKRCNLHTGAEWSYLHSYCGDPDQECCFQRGRCYGCRPIGCRCFAVLKGRKGLIKWFFYYFLIGNMLSTIFFSILFSADVQFSYTLSLICYDLFFFRMFSTY